LDGLAKIEPGWCLTLLDTELPGSNRFAWETRFIFVRMRPFPPHQRQSNRISVSPQILNPIRDEFSKAPGLASSQHKKIKVMVECAAECVARSPTLRVCLGQDKCKHKGIAAERSELIRLFTSTSVPSSSSIRTTAL
jgi:hypothetical protein